MLRRLLQCPQLLAAVFLLATSPANAAEPLRYELHFERPSTHLMDVSIHATGLKGPSVEFAMPDWAPGSYYIQNYAANIQRFRALGPGGKELAWRKTDSQTWQVELAGANAVSIEYQVYGDTLRNNQAQYDERHAFIGGPAVWMYLVGGKERPIELTIDVPSGWKVATGMERAANSTFRAADYDWFADSPLEISDFAEKDFEVLGTKYHVIVHDVEGSKDFSKFAADLQKIVEKIVPIFSPVTGGPQAAPFEDYWFLFHIWPKAGGGLEHLASTQINYATDWDDTGPANNYGTQYELKLFVASHEFFHAWNVKRLRPRPLGPFDYTQMVHTPSLWISEGLTSYYGELEVERAGLITPEHYLENIGKLITKLEAEPGRRERSIEDTSWDTWFSNGQVIRRETNLTNTWYSYYDGGQIVGHILDFAIREATGNQKSLDDWMRLLYSRYALPKPGFEPEEPVRAGSEVAGKDLSDLFRRSIGGKEAIPYEKYFAYAGITVEKKLDPDKIWLGIETVKSEEGHASLKNVIPGSPADLAGLERDDQVVAVDSRAVDLDTFPATVKEHKPGDSIRLTVLRLGRFKEIAVTLGANPNATYTLKPVENPSELQKSIYKSWLGIQ